MMAQSAQKDNDRKGAFPTESLADEDAFPVTDIEINSITNQQDQKERQQTKVVVPSVRSAKNNLDDLNSSFDAMIETAKDSKKNLDANMETVNQHLAVIRDETVKLSKIQHSKSSTSFLSVHSSANETSLVSKIDEMNQQLAKILRDIEEIKSFIKDERDQQQFEKMIMCADCGSFSYYEGCSEQWEDSADIVGMAFKWFALGHGCNIREDYTMEKNSVSEEGRKEFRSRLSTQMEDIMGHKPRFVKSDDGSFDVFYT